MKIDHLRCETANGENAVNPNVLEWRNVVFGYGAADKEKHLSLQATVV